MLTLGKLDEGPPQGCVVRRTRSEAAREGEGEVKIYILFESFSYEGDEVLGLYSSLEKADAARVEYAKNPDMHPVGTLRVVPTEVDAPPVLL